MNGEILRLVDTIHRDKDIEKEIIFEGIEAALLTAVKKKQGESETLRVTIDRDTGETTLYDGEDEIPLTDVGRIAAMTGKQVLFQKIKEAEASKVFTEYEDKINRLVTGVIQRQEGPNLIVNLGRVEGILPRGEQAPGEKFRVGERIKVLVKDVKKNINRVKITLSRTSPELVRALFELEVPEIADKVIEIMDIVREPGYRTKIAVTTYDHNVDCVGACVGVRGSRIKNIVDELFGEKIDIVRWNESIEVLIMNALKPAEISSMDLDYDARKAIVYVKPDQQSLAIGRRGQNVRLASKLAKWDLDIVTVSDEELEQLRKGEVPQGDSPLTAEDVFPDRQPESVRSVGDESSIPQGATIDPAASLVAQPAGVDTPSSPAGEDGERSVDGGDRDAGAREASPAPAPEATAGAPAAQERATGDPAAGAVVDAEHDDDASQLDDDGGTAHIAVESEDSEEEISRKGSGG